MKFSRTGIVLLLSGLALLSWSVSLPKNPVSPKDNSGNKQQSKPKKSVDVKVFFTKSDISFQGTIFIADFTLNLISEKEGFRFFKELSLENIREIEVVRWKGFAYEGKEDSFVFYPVEYRIRDIHGTDFVYSKNIPALNDFILETTLGKTRLFSYYYDHFRGKRWEITGRKEKERITGKAPEKVVNRIKFKEKEKPAQPEEKKNESSEKKL
jgi:hypothetical protein